MPNRLRIVLLLFALNACSGDQARSVVSVEQAKQIAAELRGQSGLVPPPRTITDVTSLLGQYKPDPQSSARLRQIVQDQPPPDFGSSQLLQFHVNRARAASQLGLVKQALDDSYEAVNIARKNNMEAYWAIQQLMHAESANGNARSALNLATTMLREAEKFDRKGSIITSYATLSARRSALGDISGAQQAITAAERVLNSLGAQTSANLAVMYPDWESAIQRAKAELALLTGSYAEAETQIRAAIKNQKRLQQTIDRVIATVPDFSRQSPFQSEVISTGILASALLKQNRVAEAEQASRQMLRMSLELFGADSELTATAVYKLGLVLMTQSRWTESLSLADAALEIHAALGAKRSSGAALSYSLRAEALDVLGRHSESQSAFQSALDVYSDDPDLRFRKVESTLEYMSATARFGDPARAIALIERALVGYRSRLGDRHYDTAEIRGMLAIAAFRAGDLQRALTEFRAALPILMQASRQVDDDQGIAGHDRRFKLVLETYIELLAELRPDEIAPLDAVAESFLVADAARSRGVQRALAESAARASVGDPALADLVRREQDAQRQVSALFRLYSNAMTAPAEQQDPDALRRLRSQIDQLRDARAALRTEIERRFPDYADLIDPRPASLAEVQVSLRPGEAMLVTYVGQNRTFMWAVPQHGQAAFATAALGEREMSLAVANLRRALDPNASTLGEIPVFDVTAAHALYQKLIAPVVAGLQGATSYIVVADKALGTLPFSLLVTKSSPAPQDGRDALFSGYKRVPFLVRQAAITQLPSVGALNTLRKAPPASSLRRAFVGFGDPWFSEEKTNDLRAEQAEPTQMVALATRSRPFTRRAVPQVGVDSAELAQLPRLPETADEIRSIALALGADLTQDVFLGQHATEEQVKRLDLANRKVVAFATHGLVPNDLNGLTQPALALTAPQVSNSDGDGLLTMEEVLALKLDADWVVLSACNTGAGDGAGAEAASGLGRAFFYAGARAVLLSNWPVETSSARTLTSDLFRRQAESPTLPRAHAMQQAMLALLDSEGFVENGKIVFSYAHPIFWAPFSVVGDGG